MRDTILSGNIQFGCGYGCCICAPIFSQWFEIIWVPNKSIARTVGFFKKIASEQKNRNGFGGEKQDVSLNHMWSVHCQVLLAFEWLKVQRIGQQSYAAIAWCLLATMWLQGDAYAIDILLLFTVCSYNITIWVSRYTWNYRDGSCTI